MSTKRRFRWMRDVVKSDVVSVRVHKSWKRPKCAKCGKKIRDIRKIRRVGGKSYHEKCVEEGSV